MTEQEKMLAGKIYDPSDGGAASSARAAWSPGISLQAPWPPVSPAG